MVKYMPGASFLSIFSPSNSRGAGGLVCTKELLEQCLHRIETLARHSREMRNLQLLIFPIEKWQRPR